MKKITPTLSIFLIILAIVLAGVTMSLILFKKIFLDPLTLTVNHSWDKEYEYLENHVRGIVIGKNDGCAADGVCSVTLDNGWTIITKISWTATNGLTIGDSKIGSEVWAHGRVTDDYVLSILENKGYFLKEISENDVSLSGKITEVDDGCYVDSVCRIQVDNSWWINIFAGRGVQVSGELIGINPGSEEDIGKEVEVYAKMVDKNSLSIFEDEKYYVKVIAE